MTYHPMSILLDRALDAIVDPVAIFIHDWMHALFVGGVWNITLHLFLGVLLQVGCTDMRCLQALLLAGNGLVGSMVITSMKFLKATESRNTGMQSK